MCHVSLVPAVAVQAVAVQEQRGLGGGRVQKLGGSPEETRGEKDVHRRKHRERPSPDEPTVIHGRTGCAVFAREGVELRRNGSAVQVYKVR